jgi:hypothetical protein
MNEKFNVDVPANRINKFDQQWYTIADPTLPSPVDLPGVTTYLDIYPKGIGYKLWLQRVGEDADTIRDEAGQLGTNVHKIIERTLRGETLTFETETGTRLCSLVEWERYMSWCLWYQDSRDKDALTLVAIEQIVFDLTDKVAGTIDLIADTRRGRRIFDWKTGSFVGDTASIQVNQYRKIANGMKVFGEITGAEIVQLHPSLNKKGFKVVDADDTYDDDVDAFVSIRRIWNRANPKATPKYRRYPNTVSLDFLNSEKLNLTGEVK